MKNLPIIEKFNQAREAFDESAQQVADRIGCHRTYVYEVLKYPNKNPEYFKKLCDYIESAGVVLPDDKVKLCQK